MRTMTMISIINEINHKDDLSEVVGVVGNVIETATKIVDKLYNAIIDYVKINNSPNKKIDDGTNINFTFNISEEFIVEKRTIFLKNVNITVNFTHANVQTGIALLGGGISNPRMLSMNKKGGIVYDKQENANIVINFAVKKNITFLDFIRFIISQKNENVDFFSHELKHFIDVIINPKEKFKDRARYAVSNYIVSQNIFERNLTRFSYLIYYIHDIENKVRPTQLYSECLNEKVTQSKFLEKFQNSEIYQTINEIKNLSYYTLFESLRQKMIKNHKMSDIESFIETRKYLDLFISTNFKTAASLMGMFSKNLPGKSINTDEMKHVWRMYIKDISYSENEQINAQKTFEKMIKKMKFNAEKLIKKISKIYSILPKEYKDLTPSDLEKEYMRKLNLLQY